MNVTLDTAVETNAASIKLRCQDQPDFHKLLIAVPRDQSRVFRAVWEPDGLRLEAITGETLGVSTAAIFTPEANPTSANAATAAAEGNGELIAPVDPAELARVAALNKNDARALAAERGVAWNKHASRDTMNRRIAAAMPPAGDPPAVTVVGGEGNDAIDDDDELERLPGDDIA